MGVLEMVAGFLEEQREAGEGPALTAASKIVVAVSGGPDSLALLHALMQCHPKTKLVVAHLNHGWRPAAAADADFVRRTAVSWDLACHVQRVDTVALAGTEGLSLEEAGRQARYRFLAQVADAEGADFIATGHTADDQAETVLMNLLRGSGLTGIRGMLPVTAVPGSERPLILLRPLLAVSRDTVLAYGREQQLAPLTDPSNQDVAFWRNRVRHRLLPLLNDYVPNVAAHLQQLAITTAADDSLLAHLTEDAWHKLLRRQETNRLELDRAAWRALPLSLRRRTLRHALERLRSPAQNVGFRTIEQARLVAESGQVGAESTLPGEYRLIVGYDNLTLQAATAGTQTRLPQLPGSMPLPLSPPAEVSLANGWLLTASWLAQPDLAAISANQDPWLAFLDGGRVGDLWLRPRQAGERFQPLGMGGRSAALKEVMINRKIPAALRSRWPLVAGDVTGGDNEQLVWLTGHLIDERVRVTVQSRHVLQLHCRRAG
jgi:tRNA(Ile)-lysidine synthase